MTTARLDIGTGNALKAALAAPEYQTYSRGEQIADGVVHVIGVLMSMVAVTVMIVLAALWRDPATIVSVSIYGAGVIAVFAISAAYNLTPPSPSKAILRRLDHAAIFLKIAGTYTPFAAISIGGQWGLFLLIAVWAIAAVGVVIKLVGSHRWERLSIGLYLVQGWLVALAIRPLSQALDTAALVLLIVGGGLYTLGVVFHVAPRLKFSNAIWHGFVLAASICMYIAIFRSVITG